MIREQQTQAFVGEGYSKEFVEMARHARVMPKNYFRIYKKDGVFFYQENEEKLENDPTLEAFAESENPLFKEKGHWSD